MHSGVSVNTHGTRVPLRREAVARMDTNNCFSEHSEHAPRWSDPKKHNDNRTTLKNGFAKMTLALLRFSGRLIPDRMSSSPQFRYKYFKNFRKRKGACVAPLFFEISHVFLHETHSPQNVFQFQNSTLFFASMSMVFNMETISPTCSTINFRK